MKNMIQKLFLNVVGKGKNSAIISPFFFSLSRQAFSPLVLLWSCIFAYKITLQIYCADEHWEEMEGNHRLQ